MPKCLKCAKRSHRKRCECRCHVDLWQAPLVPIPEFEELDTTSEVPDVPVSRMYRMPAEWEPHRATWIAWPHNEKDWPGKFAPIPWVFAEVVRNITRPDGPSKLPREKVCIQVQNKAEQSQAEKVLSRSGVDLNWVEFYVIPTDRVWTRDHGPLYIVNHKGQVALTNWKFNAWAKYDNWALDNEVPGRIAKLQNRKEYVATGRFNKKKKGFKPQTQQVVLEGGAIDVNGKGIALATEECLLSNNVQVRNPGLGKAGLEHALHGYLGVREVLWLKKGLVGDDTHGHIDDVARFVGPHTIVVCEEWNTKDQNYELLCDNAEKLMRINSQRPVSFSLKGLPMPDPIYFEGQRLPASYANFYIANKVVLVPVFNDQHDLEALAMMAELFKDRLVVPIYARDLVWGFGTIHCMTMQEPLGGAF